MFGTKKAKWRYAFAAAVVLAGTAGPWTAASASDPTPPAGIDRSGGGQVAFSYDTSGDMWWDREWPLPTAPGRRQFGVELYGSGVFTLAGVVQAASVSCGGVGSSTETIAAGSGTTSLQCVWAGGRLDASRLNYERVGFEVVLDGTGQLTVAGKTALVDIAVVLQLVRPTYVPYDVRAKADGSMTVGAIG